MSALGISSPARPFDQPLLSYQVIAIELTAHRAPGWAGSRVMEERQQRGVEGRFWVIWVGFVGSKKEGSLKGEDSYSQSSSLLYPYNWRVMI